MKLMPSRFPRARAVLFLAVAASATTVRGADRYFVGQGTANWANAANWAAFQGGAGGFGMPASGGFFFIRHQDSIDRNVLLNTTTPALGRLRIDNNGTGISTLIQTTGFNMNALYEGIADFGTTSNGVYTQSGGLNTSTGSITLGAAVGTGTGTYNLSGSGSISIDVLSISGGTLDNSGLFVG